uniref:DUF6268 family outer membrane beta-barrel protein n=1 Tax=Mariniflexile sp. TaxID=1979402 RepID=UPI004048A3E0
MRRIIMVALIISGINKSVGQSNVDLFSFNYLLSPIGNDKIDFYKTDFGMSVPVNLKKGLLSINLGMDFYEFYYGKDYRFSTTNLSKFNDLSYGLKYIYPLADKWKLNTQAKVSLVSNSISSISNKDLFVGGEVSVTKRLGAENTTESITLGVNYTTVTGEPRFLPTINYTKQVNDKLSYGIGFPKTYAEYKLNDLSTFKSLLLINGAYFNLSAPVSIDADSNANKSSFSSTSLMLEYNYKMDDNWVI